MAVAHRLHEPIESVAQPFYLTSECSLISSAILAGASVDVLFTVTGKQNTFAQRGIYPRFSIQ
jgi:hypothetical protein